MNQKFMIGLLVAGAALAAVSFGLRAATGGRLEVKTIDLAFLIVPVLLFALASGKLTGIDLFGVKADLSALWEKAATTPIKAQVSKSQSTSVADAVQTFEMAAKGGLSELPRLVDRKTQALAFTLSGGGYYGPAIQRYFEALSGSNQLRVIVINEPDGRLFGVFDAPELEAALRLSGNAGYGQFEQLLNGSDPSARDALARLPGFIGVAMATSSSTSKHAALRGMERAGVEILPVIDDKQRFIGTVSRAALTASLILSITEQIGGR